MLYRVAALLLFSTITAVYGAEIYRWIDEKGQTQYSDSVPKPYRQKAEPIDLKGAELSDVEREKAEARLATERATAEALMREREVRSLKERATSKESRPVSRPSPSTFSLGDKKRQCEDEWRKYYESLACFGPYRTANGGIKTEAFQHCVEVKQPAFCE